MPSTGKFSCDSCGKTYSWKPELAGKKVKCKCGEPMRVPETGPALVSVPDGFDDLAALGDGTVTEEQSYAAPVSSGKTCPSCGSSVDANAVLCVNCGHNLKTGKKLKTSAVAVGADEVMPGYRSFQMDNSEQMSPKTKKIIAFSLAGALVLIIGVVVTVNIIGTKKEKERQRVANLNAGPAILEKVIQNSENSGGLVESMKDGTLHNGMENPNKATVAQTLAQMRHEANLKQYYADLDKSKGPLALPWLQSSPKTRFYSMDHDKSITFIKDMEAMGLKEIYCIQKPEPSPPDEIVTYGIFAQMPDDAAKRKKIFEWYRQIPKMIENDGYYQDDIGQKQFAIQVKD